MSFEVVIGIEIHCELKTKTKMFSGAPVAFNQDANTCVSAVDMGFPGTLPSLNKQAVEMAVRTCMALDMQIEPLIRFDRKNYYYSDLPKGFQITQQFHPIGEHGQVSILVDGVAKKIGITRLHMEEDTAKQFHYDDGTMIDFNRAGTPLVEIVSEPDIRSGKEAAAYVEKLRSILYYLDVSDVKMEEGSMRCDVNISLRPHGSEQFGVKTEIKNLNSINNVQKAVEYEIERQTNLLLSGGVVKQETRRYDETLKATVSMRSKEGSVDYKYFPEPNIFPVRLDQAFIERVRSTLPELQDAKLERFMNDYELSLYDASLLTQNKSTADFFDAVMKHTTLAKAAANWILSELLAVLNKEGKTMDDNPVLPEHLAKLLNMIERQEISGKQAKVVFEEVMKQKDPELVVKEKGMTQVSDEGALLQLINEVLAENEQSIQDYKNGKDRAVGFLIGQIMKKSKGQANPALTNTLLVKELSKR